MTLKSKLFAGDANLLAAERDDQAHILQGASGAHVTKIQRALIGLDGAVIAARELERGQYGPSTARAVLAFKTKRKIVNRAYQTQADDIVGKMTIAALDAEILPKESAPQQQVKLEPIFPQRRLSPRRPASVTAQRTVALNFALSPSLQTLQPGFDTSAIDIPVFGVGRFQVLNGVGGVLICDPDKAAIFDPDQLTAANFVPVTKTPQVFSVRGVNAGVTTITLVMPFVSLLNSPPPILVIVRASPTKARREFHAGIQHNHRPSGKWSEISSSPRNEIFGVNDGGVFDAAVLTAICKGCSTPKCVVDKAISLRFGQLPIARVHLDWYLRAGRGRDFVEDENIISWIRLDGGIRRALRNAVDAIADKSGKKATSFEFLQQQFEETDFQFAFGAIDQVDVEFDFDLDECSVWFQDRYEWHPFYDGLYQRLEGDEARVSNCLHAALVEMQADGASDFWMKGQATVPMEKIFAK